MKTSLNLSAVALSIGLAAAPLVAQYPAAAYRAPNYAVLQAAPATGPMAFRPVNAPTQQTQRILTASKSPTVAPAPVRTASQPMAPTYSPSQGWESPNAAYSGGAPYAGGFSGQAAPMDYSYSGPGASGGCGCDGGGVVAAGGCGGCDACGCGGRHGCGLCGHHGCGLFGHHGCGHHGCGCGCGCGGHTCCVPFCTTGDLVQHMPFFGTTHGYYYFRPYHVMHVFSQQELATRWGGDARNPYDNTMFQRIYEQMGVAAVPTATTPQTIVPSPIEYTAPSNSTVVPGPTPAYGPGPQYNAVPQYAPQYNAVPQYVPGRGAGMVQPGNEYVPGPVR